MLLKVATLAGIDSVLDEVVESNIDLLFMTAIFDETPEESFGRMVAFTRERKGMSQREFASELSRIGMKVDGPAVSRLEKGARALKLSEAFKVAEALDVDLELLLSITRSPAEEFRRRREGLEYPAGELAENGASFFDQMSDIELLLSRHPELLEPASRHPHGESDFPEWFVRTLIEKIKVEGGAEANPNDFGWLENEAQKERYLSLARELLESRIIIGTHPLAGKRF